jgi:hypothetical protein
LVRRTGSLPAEAYPTTRKGNSITIEGDDGSGVIYGALSLAEKLDQAIPLQTASRLSITGHQIQSPLGFLSIVLSSRSSL